MDFAILPSCAEFIFFPEYWASPKKKFIAKFFAFLFSFFQIRHTLVTQKMLFKLPFLLATLALAIPAPVGNIVDEYRIARIEAVANFKLEMANVINLAKNGSLGHEDYGNDPLPISELITKQIVFVRNEIQQIIQRPSGIIMTDDDEDAFIWWVYRLKSWEEILAEVTEPAAVA
jgi:hypothetical protein